MININFTNIIKHIPHFINYTIVLVRDIKNTHGFSGFEHLLFENKED